MWESSQKDLIKQSSNITLLLKNQKKMSKKKNCKCRRNIKIIVKKKIIDKSALTVQKMSDLSRWKSFKLLYD